MQARTKMGSPEITEVDPGDEVSCDGGKIYGHPKVYLTAGDDGFVDCYYCGRRFRLTGAARDGAEQQGAA